jgi:hypothetical protein
MKIQIIILLLLICVSTKAQEKRAAISLNGQITSWAIGQIEKPFGIQFGGRFVPTLLGNYNFTENSKLDFEASFNINGSLNFNALNYDTILGQIKPYRIWGRYSGQNWEVRAGLQKINFGSAKMFRPLMWFDGMDVRDPLQLTDGVYGALARYYFENNANIWFWTLIGNNNPKGYEMYGTHKIKPEIGGRFQTPAGPGEIAFSLNNRVIRVESSFSSNRNDFALLNESRVGLDGKWDLGIGLWFESSVTLTEKYFYLANPIQDAWNFGADYTIPVGNGLGVTLEYFRYHAGKKFFMEGNTLHLIGSMFTYPVSILDNLSAMVFYLPTQKLWCNYVSWSRTYDNWNIYAIGYWNPNNFQLMNAQSQSKNMFSGKGLQLMLNYNF